MSTIRDQLVETLERENDELRERIRQLEEMLGVHLPAPLCLRLSGAEGKIFGLLVERELATKAAIMSLLYSDRAGDEPDIKIADVFVCKMRAKLRPFEITIDTAWGQGYAMPDESKAKARALIGAQAK